MKDQILTLGNGKLVLELENKILLDAPNKGKRHASDIQENLEYELKNIKSSLSIECKNNRVLQENMKKFKY